MSRRTPSAWITTASDEISPPFNVQVRLARQTQRLNRPPGLSSPLRNRPAARGSSQPCKYRTRQPDVRRFRTAGISQQRAETRSPFDHSGAVSHSPFGTAGIALPLTETRHSCTNPGRATQDRTLPALRGRSQCRSYTIPGIAAGLGDFDLSACQGQRRRQAAIEVEDDAVFPLRQEYPPTEATSREESSCCRGRYARTSANAHPCFPADWNRNSAARRGSTRSARR